MTEEVPFAIRSGGHSPSPGAANINDGVLIDLAGLTEVTYDTTSGTVTVGAGNKWGAVYKALDAYNVTAVGARDLDVGVGGFLLQSKCINDMLNLQAIVLGDWVLTTPKSRWSFLLDGFIRPWLR